MAASTRRADVDPDGEPEFPATRIGVCEAGPGRFVFLESGNGDGWIASDLAVDVRR